MAWHYNDLTSAAGGAPQKLSQPTGYAFDAYGTRHVTYVGIDRHVHELWWNISGWHHKDLTVAAGAPDAQVNRNCKCPTKGLRATGTTRRPCRCARSDRAARAWNGQADRAS